MPHYTYDDYLHWKGDWELIHGIPYAMAPAPTVEHQHISNKIARYLTEALDPCQHCHALLPVDWKIADDTVVQPDNLVICFPPKGTYITKTPTLIFEILSKSSAQKDQTTKYRIYEKEGVKYYIIVDPVERIAKVFQRVSGKFQKLMGATDETVSFDINDGSIQFDFGKIF